MCFFGDRRNRSKRSISRNRNQTKSLYSSASSSGLGSRCGCTPATRRAHVPWNSSSRGPFRAPSGSLESTRSRAARRPGPFLRTSLSPRVGIGHTGLSFCEAGLVLGPAGSRPALYASLCLLFGRIPGNSAPGTTNLWNSSHNKLGGRKAHTSLSSADMHTVSCRFSLCAVELPASCAGAAVRAPASHGPTSPSSASPR